ncbi:hypothetical protein TOT_040000858 [Theileria orientalis strain Shintoku]|uniref:Uncharacterized protein n=1 Tax=Theileria orientalis strain Shintoku TaxID=869250 RepID=J7M4T0_THEOR|nr:hypothetical protein TOT_040000858 [Theileria orientalis strain Shintoku]PVC49847.1 hypothetical protein MACL_00002720 [Theileria orientalis]BAM42490.1 hypothetical protein TOT_040000858 [Theileria orientalis strain Shintoku]|eukprot:XP_009692791.1 hypothetical protein TOT_040000858 [Theileria orientalis strain Shintoku]
MGRVRLHEKRTLSPAIYHQIQSDIRSTHKNAKYALKTLH